MRGRGGEGVEEQLDRNAVNSDKNECPREEGKSPLSYGEGSSSQMDDTSIHHGGKGSVIDTGIFLEETARGLVHLESPPTSNPTAPPSFTRNGECALASLREKESDTAMAPRTKGAHTWVSS